MSLDGAIALLAPQLRHPVLSLSAATQLLDRLRYGVEDEEGTRRLMRALSRILPTPPHPAVPKQLLSMLPFLEHPIPVVEELATLIGEGDLFLEAPQHEENMDRSDYTASSNRDYNNFSESDCSTLQAVLESYMAILNSDRNLLLPILGSLFDLPIAGNRTVTKLAREALSIVAPIDVPTVVRT